MDLKNKIDKLRKFSTLRAIKLSIEPYYFWDQAEIDQLTYFPFPSIGDHRPEGFKLIRSLFCDSTGAGTEEEPALTERQLHQELQVNMAYAIIEEGPSQLYVGEFQIVPD